MAGLGGHNPDPECAGNEDVEYPEQECPMCGEVCKNLPAHLRHSCDVTD